MNNSESGTSFFAKIKDSLQMIMYICAITGTTLLGIFKGCVGREPESEPVVADEQNDADVVDKLAPAEKSKEDLKSKTTSEPAKEVVVKPVPTEKKTGVESVSEPEKPAAKLKSEPKKMVKPAPKAPDKLDNADQNNTADVKPEPKAEPTKVPTVKPMTKKEVEELKKKNEKDKKDLDEKRKAEDPTDSSSNVKEDTRKEIDNEADDFMKQLN